MQITATYSPDDNKLRLYASSRLDAETFARVKAAGFIWAPKQEVFVAPMWTPAREDLARELAGDIEDEDTTLVERAEDRAERFTGYSERRTAEAQAARNAVSAIADAIPFGQPILVGHHSERHARRDAERIQNGMRRAVQLWDTASYWTERAAGAVQAAKYKERADVRARRIKRIEADRRAAQREQAQAQRRIDFWSREDVTHELAVRATGGALGGVSRCYPLADFPRAAPASQYEGHMSTYSALTGGVIGVDQARGIELPAARRVVAHYARWIAHYDNRLAYERAMLAEQGGLVAERVAIEVGGQVRIGSKWRVVVRVNRSEGRVVSVTTNGRYRSVYGIEEVEEYRAPSAEAAATVKAAMKLPPLVNYAGLGFIGITRAQWDAIPSDYKGTQKVGASADAGAHRVRKALGCYVLQGETDSSKRHSYPFVFITDAKIVQPPQAADAPPVKVPASPAPEVDEQPQG